MIYKHLNEENSKEQLSSTKYRPASALLLITFVLIYGKSPS